MANPWEKIRRVAIFVAEKDTLQLDGKELSRPGRNCKDGNRVC